MSDDRTAGLRRALVEVVGPADVLADPELTAGYRVDWTGRFAGPPALVVRPGSAAEVAGVVAACRAVGAALVPQGGNTGLVGGGVPLAGEVVVSLRRLAGVTSVDGGSGQLVAGAGTTIGEVQRAAAAAGWAYAVDLASRDGATLGGTIATNAGGLRVLRHGDTRRQLMAVEAVLGTGAVVGTVGPGAPGAGGWSGPPTRAWGTSGPLGTGWPPSSRPGGPGGGGLFRDNTGYHLPSLLCGSEGTLGLVTAARVRLVPALAERVVALVAFAGVAGAVAAAGGLRRALPAVEAVELVLQPGLDLVCRVGGLPRPFPEAHPAYLVVEVADDRDRTADLEAALASVAGVADVAVALDPARRRALWRYREGHTEAINTLGAPHKLDTALPIAALPEFVARVPAAVEAVAPGARVWLFGHVADGNVHVNVTGVARDDDRVDDTVFRLVAELGGSISAEHGIGTAKRRWVHLTRSPAELTTWQALRAALDPDGILNPAVLRPT